MIRIALVDQNRLYRKGVETLLNSFENIKVVFDTDNGLELMEVLKHTQVDIVIVDIQMRELDGMVLCRRLKIRYPKVHFLVFSQISDRNTISRMLEIGMSGYFSKDSEPLHLKQVIATMLSQGYYFDNITASFETEALLNEKVRKAEEGKNCVSITIREMEIIRLACKEYNSSEIADILSINVRTVETHRKRMIQKTKAKNFIGVILYALKHKLLVLDHV